MQYSTNFNMNKPERADQYNLNHWNENTDVIDTELKALQSITDSAFKTALLNFCYPIGSLYWSSNSANPSTLFGGTWTQIKDKFVWAKGDSDTVNATGGSKTVTITSANLPTHTHTFEHTHEYTPSGSVSSSFSGISHDFYVCRADGLANMGLTAGINTIKSYSTSNKIAEYAARDNDQSIKLQWTDGGTVTSSFTGTKKSTTSQSTSTTGDGGFANTAVNIMNPYIVKYCWERTA